MLSIEEMPGERDGYSPISRILEKRTEEQIRGTKLEYNHTENT